MSTELLKHNYSLINYNSTRLTKKVLVLVNELTKSPGVSSHFPF